ncbi:MAG: AAA family ATPase [Pseudomonadales bacterium]|nr:AAA family ATPase [Pseudomonadales bacterium]
MYYEYFGLREAPFSIAPNPQYLYMSERHREALAHLLYGIKSDGGFILLTGEVGTGKTTVCRCLLEQIPEDVHIAFVLNPKMDSLEMLATVCDELGISYPEQPSIKHLVDNLSAFLLKAHEQGRKTVVIIDEAQNLAIDVLEQLRLLTNLETNQRKLLQIILLGQPELLDLLATRELRQLSQRVTARFHLDALTRAETEDYIAHRLDIAGVNQPLFPRATINRIYQHSGGIPRLINLICDRSLLGTYTEEKGQVTPAIVNRAAAEILGQKRPAEKVTVRQLQMVIGGLVLAILSSLVYLKTTPAPTVEAQPVVDTVTTRRPQPADYSGSNPPSAAEWIKDIRTEAGAGAGSTQQRQTRLQSLSAVTGSEDRNQAAAPVLALWGAAEPAAGQSVCEVAANSGLACLDSVARLDELERSNRPVLIQLSATQQSDWAAMVALDSTTATLITQANGEIVVPRASLEALGPVDFLLFWRAPPGWQQPGKLGDSGAAVDWLVTQLALIEGESPALQPGRIFDTTIEQAVRDFQRRHQLPETGVADAETWIHINGQTDAAIPRLRQAGAS